MMKKIKFYNWDTDKDEIILECTKCGYRKKQGANAFPSICELCEYKQHRKEIEEYHADEAEAGII
jgi:Zn ribbon nucleic-acid-binding protein